MGRRAVLGGARAGAIGGLVTLAAMYVASGLAGLKALPDVLQQPILALMPGPVFGFLIDNLQHAGKVLEEAGILVTLEVGFAALGALYGWAGARRPFAYLGLGAGALGWAVVTLVLLPLSGEGFLGLAEGLSAPLVWAVLWVVYSVVLQAAWQPETAEPADPGRRQMLSLLPVGLGAVALIVLGVRLLPVWYRAIAAPPEAGLSGPSPELTPVENFYVVSKNFSDPVVGSEGWKLSVQGLVDQPYKLAYGDLTALSPATTEEVTLECISNDVGGPQMSTGRFAGVPLRDLVQRATPKAGATAIAFEAADGYVESMPLEMALGDARILVAYQLNDRPLTNAHGFPARVLIPGRYGMKGPKWLNQISLAGSEPTGYWEAQGWSPAAPVKTTSRFDAPADGSIVKLGPIQLVGVAFAGTRGVQAVEYSADGGKSWSSANLKAPLSPMTWVLWTAAWTPSVEGAYTLKVRARDGSGDLQSSRVLPSYPSGATGFHTIHVNVSHR